MAKQTSIGISVALSVGAPASYDETGFSAKSYTAVNPIESFSAFGATFGEDTFDDMGTGVQDVALTIANNGTLTLGLGEDDEDLGQALIYEAVYGSTRRQQHSARIIYPNGAIRYFTCKISGAPENPGTGGAFIRGEVTLRLDNDVIRINSTP